MLLFVFKSVHGTAPLYIADLIQEQKSFTIPVTESFSCSKDESEKRGGRALAAAVPRLWNSLPLYIRQ